MATSPSYDYFYDGPSLNARLAAFLPDELREPPLDEIDCNGFLVRTYLNDLEALVGRELGAAAGPVRRLLDLGCGSGGLVRYLTGRLGCDSVMRRLVPSKAPVAAGMMSRSSSGRQISTGLGSLPARSVWPSLSTLSIWLLTFARL